VVDVETDIAFYSALGVPENGGLGYTAIEIQNEEWVLFGDTQKPGVDDDGNVLVVYGPRRLSNLSEFTKYDNQLWPLGHNGDWNDKITRVQFVDVNPDFDFKKHDPTIVSESATVLAKVSCRVLAR
jgi:hypothetical protein